MKREGRRKLKGRIALIWELFKQGLPPRGEKRLPPHEKIFSIFLSVVCPLFFSPRLPPGLYTAWTYWGSKV